MERILNSVLVIIIQIVNVEIPIPIGYWDFSIREVWMEDLRKYLMKYNIQDQWVQRKIDRTVDTMLHSFID